MIVYELFVRPDKVADFKLLLIALSQVSSGELDESDLLARYWDDGEYTDQQEAEVLETMEIFGNQIFLNDSIEDYISELDTDFMCLLHPFLDKGSRLEISNRPGDEDEKRRRWFIDDGYDLVCQETSWGEYDRFPGRL